MIAPVTGITGNPRLKNGSKCSLELELHVSELRYRRLFETAQDGILILDGVDGHIIDANPFLLDLLGYPFEGILGLQLWEIGLFEDIAANKAAFTRLQVEEYIRYEDHPLRTKSGRIVAVEFVSNVYFVGRERVIQCNIRDISERTATQTASDQRFAALEIAGKAKDDVIAILSHELRTPLTAISAMIDVVELGEDLGKELVAGEMRAHFSKDAVALIHRNVQALARLIDDLLDLSHLAQGTIDLKLESVNANEVIGFVVKNHESRRVTSGIEMILRLEAQPSQIYVDALKLEQVLSNLVGNALKFTPTGGKVSILTRNGPTGNLVIEVSDNGIGIAGDSLTRILSPFEQGDPSIHPRYGGVGLGLSIADTLTSALGGTLEIESDGPGLGSKFTVTFATQDPSAAKENAQETIQT